MVLTTTLKQLKAHHACDSGLKTLIASLPEDHDEETLIPLSHILESNGLEHAIWSLRTQDSKYSVQFAIACAERVLPIFENQFPEDDRPRKAIEAAKAVVALNTDPKYLDLAVCKAEAKAVLAAEAAAAASINKQQELEAQKLDFLKIVQ